MKTSKVTSDLANSLADIWNPVMIEQGKKINPKATDEEAINIVVAIGSEKAGLTNKE